jgi:UDP-2-acetamido-3-amino-2,3-dideoxy-glucuronate N-acetyltransferase
MSELPEVFVHPTATVDAGAQVGRGTRIWHYCHVMDGARLGERCILGQNVFVGAKAVIGDRVKIQNNVSVYDAVTLEDEVFCGPSMVFTNVVVPRAFIERKGEYQPTRVCHGATLGANSTIVCGHTIGAYAMVGAGAVVTGDVKPHALMLGVPARQTGWACRCGLTLRGGERLVDGAGELQCRSCGARYQVVDGALRLEPSADR